MEKENKKVWVISFTDVKEEFWREEINDYLGNFFDYGKVKTFKTKNACDEFIVKNTDSRAYDFYSKEITQKELETYENN